MIKLIIFVLFYTSVLFSQDNKTLIINIGFEAPAGEFIDLITKEAFKRADLNVKTQVLPHKRALVNANNGLEDGDAARVWMITKYFHNLERVPIINSKIELVALSKKKIFINKASDLDDYNVGIINGMKIAVHYTNEAETKSLTKVQEYKSLLAMLKEDRLDIVLVNKVSLYKHINLIKGLNLYLVKKPLLSKPLYLYLHKKNSQYIPVLEKAYQSMYEDGTYKKMHKSFYGSMEEKLLKNIILVEDK